MDMIFGLSFYHICKIIIRKTFVGEKSVIKTEWMGTLHIYHDGFLFKCECYDVFTSVLDKF